MNDRQFEETADAAPAAAPAVGHEETAAVAAVSEGARLWSEWFSGPIGGHGYLYKGDHGRVVAGIDGLIAERDDAKAELARLREWFDGYDGLLSPSEAELLRQIRERGKSDPDCRRLAEILDAAIRTRDNLESDLTNIGPVRQAYRETLTRLDEVAKERDQLRARLSEAERECERLEAECQELADKGDGANLRHAQLWARCERAERERDEARAAGRELVAENATLRAERDALKAALGYAEKEIAGVLAEARRHAENARGGPLERGKAGRGAE